VTLNIYKSKTKYLMLGQNTESCLMNYLLHVHTTKTSTNKPHMTCDDWSGTHCFAVGDEESLVHVN
jgi:hypothetical protein